ncbi:butyrophilin subfamily 2 member A2-like isoform X2 [Sebastes umbrosus]|uniref:butyrophilin subfamily 2 member A2-like isoform X2 n=1 Tax=Sebastes umbrosus TaxID=72105 RepID=UPI0018A105E3|nr:butyrophilin subfamily 2 member A2-like isoform X2 [Sebastes umbrosus]
MGALTMFLVAALSASRCSAAPVSGSLEVLVSSPVSVHLGHTTTLPCWLNPPQSAESLEVSWYRGSYSTPIMFYRAKQFENSSQEASYAGRVSFGLKDAASGGLTAGDVSLKLDNATIEDAGDYNCYVSSEQGYDRASVSVIVTEIGALPLLSAVWKEDNMVNMSCESEGWYPKPSLRWSDQKQVLTPESLKYRKGSSGLQSVHSWLLVSSSTEVSCSVGVSGEETKEARVRLENPHQPESSGSSPAGWVAFALLLIAMVVALLGVLYFMKRRKKAESGNDLAEENQPLLPKGVIQPTHLSKNSQIYANVTLDQKEHKYLLIRDGKLRDARCNFPDGARVTCLTAIKGTSGFSSGQHYWEVSLGKTDPRIGLKQSWWVGVTSAAVIPDESDFSPTTSNGFWFLSSSPDKTDSLQLSTDTHVFLPISSQLQTVGVYLNYDSGELSFYNVEDKRLIGTLTANFTGVIFPLFNPGKDDKAVMEILQGQASDTGNSVDSTAQESES